MVIVFGSINLDLIFSLPSIPRSGETVLGPSTRIEPGGKGANQAGRRRGTAPPLPWWVRWGAMRWPMAPWR